MATPNVQKLQPSDNQEIENMPLLTSDGKTRRRRAASMSDSEIMTILIMFHFGTFDNFKHYYLHFIRIHLRRDFPDAVSYNLIAALGAYCFFDNKPEAIQGYCIEDTNQLSLF